MRPPKTELGERIKEQSGAASVLVDRWVEEIGEDNLDKLDDETVPRALSARSRTGFLGFYSKVH